MGCIFEECPQANDLHEHFLPDPDYSGYYIKHVYNVPYPKSPYDPIEIWKTMSRFHDVSQDKKKEFVQKYLDKCVLGQPEIRNQALLNKYKSTSNQ